MMIEVHDDADAVAKRAAAVVAEEARVRVDTAGRFVFAVSGGTTPLKMLFALTKENVPWERVHVVQVDERVAPSGHADRNLTHLYESLLASASIPYDQIHTMKVEDKDVHRAAAEYAELIKKITDGTSVIDLVHLGLGADGHTASLVPDDPVLDFDDVDVAMSEIYQGRNRMTLTYPAINRARRILWLVTGREKASMLPRLQIGDTSIPAGRVRQTDALLLADRSAVGPTTE
jgi:6-phosphogluconolactonase